MYSVTAVGLNPFFTCFSYATTFWLEISKILKRKLTQRATTIHEVWEVSWNMVKRQGGMKHLEWMARVLCGAWCLWRYRNRVIFDGPMIQPNILAASCVNEMNLWLRFC